MVTDHRVHEHWTNSKTFIIASIASAVGVANIWRFPYMAAENGGGSFIIPYLIGVLLFGVPIMVLEFLVGSKLKKTPICAFKKLIKKYYVLSYIPLLLKFVVASYYVVITGWTLAYFLFSLQGAIPKFSEFIQTDYSLYFTLIVLGLTFAVVRAGVHKGLEKINQYLVPVFLLSLAVLFFGSISVYGIDAALNYYTTINPEILFSPTTWTLAFSQAFFSLGVGFCLMLTYGGYLRKKTDIISSSWTVSLVDTTIALFAGFMIFTLAFGNGVSIDSGPSLAFDSLPTALNTLPLAQIALPLFFLLLFSAALTSAVSVVEVPLTVVEDEFGLDRKKSVIALGIFLVFASIPSALSYSFYGLELSGMPFLDFLDWGVMGHLSPLAALITTVILAWSYKDLDKQIRYILSPTYSTIFLILVRFLIPVFLTILFLSQFFLGVTL